MSCALIFKERVYLAPQCSTTGPRPIPSDPQPKDTPFLLSKFEIANLLMPNTTSCANGILPSNPDTEGIGTRIAVYAQLFIAIFTIALSPTRFWFHSWRELVWTSISLQVSVISQPSDLTLFDALIVTWLAFPIFALSMATFIAGRWGAVLMPREVWLLTIAHALLFVMYVLTYFFLNFFSLLLTDIHCSCVPRSLGLFVWSNESSFGSCPTLNNSIQFVVLGLSVSPSGGIKPFALAFSKSYNLNYENPSTKLSTVFQDSVMLVAHVIGVTFATMKSKKARKRVAADKKSRGRKGQTRTKRLEYNRMSSRSPLPKASSAMKDEHHRR